MTQHSASNLQQASKSNVKPKKHVNFVLNMWLLACYVENAVNRHTDVNKQQLLPAVRSLRLHQRTPRHAGCGIASP